MTLPLMLRCGITNHPTFYDMELRRAPCTKLECPTLEHLLNDVRKDHEDFCGCEVAIEPQAWLACYHLKEDSSVGIDTSCFTVCDLTDELESFADRVNDPEARGALHILFEGRSTGTGTIDRGYRLPSYFEHDMGTVFQTFGGNCRLPIDEDVDYPVMFEKPGLVVVDKSRFLLPARSQPVLGYLPLIRRPKGFGKTTFLSLMSSWCSRYYAGSGNMFPSVYHDELYPETHPLYTLCLSGCMVVLHLDLGTLNVSPGMTDEALKHSCRIFLDEAARICYRRYRGFLQPLVGAQDPEASLAGTVTLESSAESIGAAVNDDTAEHLTFKDLLDLTSLEGRDEPQRLFVGVDNYTAPLANVGWSTRHESIIASEIFEPLINGLLSGSVYRALAVGDSDVPDGRPDPYCMNSHFDRYTCDLTDSPRADEILGVTESEIVAFGRAVFGDAIDFLAQVQARVSKPDDNSNFGESSKTSYSTRDILAFARALLTTPQDPTVVAAVKIQTFRSSRYSKCQADIYDTVPLWGRNFSKMARWSLMTKRKEYDYDDDCDSDEARSDTDVSETRSGSPKSSIAPTVWTSRLPSSTSSLSSLQTRADAVLDKKSELLSQAEISRDECLRAVSQLSTISPSASSRSCPPSPTQRAKRRRLSE